MTTPDQCPDPSVHGNPFRYCRHCDWREEQTTPGDEHAVLRERLAWAVYGGRNVGGVCPAPLDWAAVDALLPVVTAHTDAALAEQREQMVEAKADAWDEGSTAGWNDCAASDEASRLDRPQPDETANPYRVVDVVREVGGS